MVSIYIFHFSVYFFVMFNIVLQGASLYSYNDAQFEDDDWEGILKLGTSRKVKDALKVGRFGLGFKSVFHLTGIYYYNNYYPKKI